GPGGATWAMTYHADEVQLQAKGAETPLARFGLLASFTDPDNFESVFEYDDLGRLTSDRNVAQGSSQQLEQCQLSPAGAGACWCESSDGVVCKEPGKVVTFTDGAGAQTHYFVRSGQGGNARVRQIQGPTGLTSDSRQALARGT